MSTPATSRAFPWSRDAFLLLIVFLAVYKNLQIDGYTDFDVYYDYGKKIWATLNGNANVSYAVDPSNSSPFRYAPIWGIFFAPLSLLPHPVARALWVIFQWICYERALGKVKRFFNLSHAQEWLLILGTLRFAWDNSSIGQISCLFALLMIEAAIALNSWKTGAASFALAASLKFQPLVLLALPLLKKQWKLVSGTLGGLAILLGASFLISNEATQAYFALAQNSVSVLAIDTIGNQSLYGALSRAADTIATPLFGGALAFTALLCLYLWKKSGWDLVVAWVLGLAMLPVFGVLTWKNTYVLFLFPLAYFTKCAPRATFAIALAFALTSQGVIGRDLNGTFLFYGVLPLIAWIGTLILGFLTISTRENTQTGT